MMAYSFSAIDHAGAIRFDHPPTDSELALSGDDMCVAPPVTVEAPATQAAPLFARVRFVDPERDYRASVALVRNGVTEGAGVLAIEAPLALATDQAEAIGRAALRALDAQTISFALPATRLEFEAGDRIRFDAARYRIVSITDEAVRMVTAVRDDLTPARVRAAAPPNAPVVAARPNPTLAFLDLPPLPGAEEDSRPLVAAAAQPWRALDLHVGASAGTAAHRGAALDPAIIGTLEWALYPGPVGRFDRGNRIRARFPGWAALAGVSEFELLAGANAFGVRQSDGRWEVLQAQSIVLVGPGLYEFSSFLRGQQGTADCMGAPAPVGATIVKLDARLARLDLADAELQSPLMLFATAQGGPASEAESPAAMTWTRTWARPFSPCHLRAVRAANGDVWLSWVRRTRIGGDSWAVYEAPLGEEAEAYRVEILSGTNVVRRIETTAPAWVYTAAQQMADFGAPPSSLRWRAAQLSSAYGPGASAESLSPL